MSTAPQSQADSRPEPGGQIPVYYTAHAVFWFGIYLIVSGPWEFSINGTVGHLAGLAIAFFSGLVIHHYMPAPQRDRFGEYVPRDMQSPGSR